MNILYSYIYTAPCLPKSHLHQYLLRCGIKRVKPGCELLAAEKCRTKRIELASVSVQELQRVYDDQWAIVVGALRRYGGPVHTGFGLNKRLDTEERLHNYVADPTATFTF